MTLRLALIATLCGLALSACAGAVDRDPAGLYDPGSDQITRPHHQ